MTGSQSIAASVVEGIVLKWPSVRGLLSEFRRLTDKQIENLTKEISEKKKKIDKLYKELPEEKVQDLKKRKIKELKREENKNNKEKVESNNFLRDIIEFKEWLNQRTYLKGDLDKLEIWITNLSKKLHIENSKKTDQHVKGERTLLLEQFRQIPPNFFDEKTRIAINKKLHGTKRTNSDNYYLRKLNSIIGEKLCEASYYKVIKRILEL